MPNLVGIGNSQVPTNAMLGGMAYQDPAHANLTSVEIENIAAIKAKISQSANRIFVYDTRKDSDGGAWRKRCSRKSWYNETLGTAQRGNRKEFPSVAVIASYNNGFSFEFVDQAHNSTSELTYKLYVRCSQSGTQLWYGWPGQVSTMRLQELSA